MKQINHAVQASADDNVLRRLQTGLQDVLKVGAEDEHLQAQEVLANQLGRMLDDHYILLRNLVLEAGAQPIPMILFGPSGIWVINAYGGEGLFRAEGEEWLVLNPRTQQFQVAPKNLIRQTLELAGEVKNFLLSLGETYPAPQPILFCGHPGAHIDASQPAVRIVRMDGVERLYGLLVSGRPVLDGLQIHKAVEALVKTSEQNRAQKVEVKLPDRKDEFWQEESQEDKRSSLSETFAGINLPPVLKNLRLTTQQWIILGVMAVFEILLLIAFIFLILLVV